MKHSLLKILLMMASGMTSLSCSAQAPAGKLIYCSYSCTGVAGLGKDYCELIADPGADPKVVVVLNQDNHLDPGEIRAEYTVDAAVVDSMQAMLAEMKVYRLNGYDHEEDMTGGSVYRIYQEYDSGDKVNSRWYGHDIKEDARAAYAAIERFFEPWRTRARAEVTPVIPGRPETAEEDIEVPES